MSIITRLAFGYLALTGVVVGIWAYVLPAAFYARFPGFGRTWVSADGPFNEHLIRDTGAAYLMIAALSELGWLRPTMVTPLVVGLVTLCFNLLHFAYHMTHLDMYGPVDKIGNIVALGAAVLASAWLMTPWARAHAWRR